MFWAGPEHPADAVSGSTVSADKALLTHRVQADA